ncbi:MAG: hypothetical protein ACKOAG_09840, partial [Candidatus Kapaibacterium sp.]
VTVTFPEWTIPQSPLIATLYVAISGDCGIVNSGNVTVTQIASTVITAQPSTSTPQICIGQPFSISVSATGAALGYQWQRNSVNITGATAATYSVASSTSADFATYSVIVTGTCGQLTSQTVTIVQIPGTVINTQPVATTTLCAGAPFAVSVTASGSNVTYQWQKQSGASFVPVGGATSSSYTVSNVTTSDAGTYRVIVTGTCGTLTSSNAILVVNTALAVATQPTWTSANACTGETTTISMTATGTVASYQWQKFNGVSWQDVAGATSNTYTIASLVLNDAGAYRMQLNGPCSPTTFSNQANLSVQQNVQINAQPAPQTACVGSSISFTVTTIGTVLGYQWEQDRLGNGTWLPIAGATNATYTKNGVTALDSGSYRIKVTGNCSAI